MHVFRHSGSEKRSLGDEERVTYQGDQIRVVLTRIPAGHLQRAHRHEHLYDATYVIHGEVAVIEEDDSGVERSVLQTGDFVILDPGPHHTLHNTSPEDAHILTVKCVRRPDLTPDAFRQLCTDDWYSAPTQIE